MDHWRCLCGDTLIKQDIGWTKIKDIDVACRVLGSDGLYHLVTQTRSLTPDRRIISARVFSLLPIIGTEDHRVLVEIGGARTGRKIRKNTPIAKWITLGEIERLLESGETVRILSQFDKIVEPTFTPSIHEINFLGLYMAEGCLANEQRGKKYRVEFCFNVKERCLAELIRKAARKLWGANVGQRAVTDARNGNHYLKVWVCNRKAVEFIEKYIHGDRAPVKEFDESVMRWPIRFQLELLRVMMRGDGCALMTRKSLTHVYSTTSRILALQVQTIYFRAGKIASIVYQKPHDTWFGKNAVYHVRHYPLAKYTKGFIEDGFFKSTVFKTEEIFGVKEVIDISVDGTHDFQTEGGIAHNCEYCQWHQGCWEGYDKEFEALATDVAMEQGIEETCKYYLELNEHLSSMNTEKEELKEKIKKAMKDKGLRKGYTELYNATLSLRKWTGLDNDLIPPKILEAATISKPFEMLTIRLRNKPRKPRKQKESHV